MFKTQVVAYASPFTYQNRLNCVSSYMTHNLGNRPSQPAKGYYIIYGQKLFTHK